MFEQSVLGDSHAKTKYTFFCSAVLQSIVICTAAIVSLFCSTPFENRQPLSQRIAFWSAAQAPRSTETTVKRAYSPPMFDESKLMAPAAIPQHVPLIEDASAPAIAFAPSLATALSPGAGLGSLVQTATPPLKSVAPQPRRPDNPEPIASSHEPVQVGGRVQQAKLVYSPVPPYPALAKQQRIAGMVKLQAIVGKDGGIEHLRALSGHPLLIPAALDAVAKWRYRPTLLNNEPVEVVTEIEVHFTLNP
jgi:protein TonB